MILYVDKLPVSHGRTLESWTQSHDKFSFINSKFDWSLHRSPLFDIYEAPNSSWAKTRSETKDTYSLEDQKCKQSAHWKEKKKGKKTTNYKVLENWNKYTNKKFIFEINNLAIPSWMMNKLPE